MKMKTATSLLIGLLICSAALGSTGQIQPPKSPKPADPITNPEAEHVNPGVMDEATDEIERRGDCVTLHGYGIADGFNDTISKLYGIPKDDSNKWFISVVTTSNCAGCERLKAAFNSDPHLKAWANPSSPKTSWSHYKVYRYSDPTQKWRWKNIKITSFPTIIIQPPLSKSFGNPATVVYQQSGYDGNAMKLSASMSSALRTYARKLYRKNLTPQSVVVNQGGGHGQQPAANQGTGQAPPFLPMPQTPTFPQQNPFPQPVQIPPQIQPANQVPPQVQPQPVQQIPQGGLLVYQLIQALMSGNMITSLLLAVLIAVQIWRTYRKQKGLPLLIDDETAGKIAERIRDLISPKEASNAGDQSARR